MMQKLTRIVGSTSLLLAIMFSAVPVDAQGSISLVANKATVSSGGSLIVAVYMNGGGTPIYGVQANIAYPASKLQYVGLSYTGSAFEITASGGGGDGVVNIARGTTSPVSGSGLVATITFKALSSTGSASLSVDGSSGLGDGVNSTSIAYGTQGTSVNFGATSAATDAATPVAPKDTTPPVITAIKIKALTPLSATITWTTSEVADSVVDFGLDNSYGLSNSSSTPVTAHSVTLASTFLTPQTLFHYHVKSTDGAGNVAASPDQTLNLPGIPITVIVRGPGGKPQAGAMVTLDNATGTTNAKGIVVLASGLGNKKVTTTYQGVTIQKPITVTKTTKPLPPIQLDLSKKPLNHWMLTSFGLLVFILVLLGIDAMLFGSHFFARLLGLRFGQPASPLSSGMAPARTIAEAQAAARRGQDTIVSADSVVTTQAVGLPPTPTDALRPLTGSSQSASQVPGQPISDFVSTAKPIAVTHVQADAEPGPNTALATRLKRSTAKTRRAKRKAAKKPS